MAAYRTVLYDWHVAHGGRIVPFAGWDMPVQYTGIVAEHLAVRNQAGLFDISHMGRLEIAGPQATEFLEWVFTNGVASLKANQVRYGLLCQERGGILDDVLLYRWPGHYLLVVNAANRDKVKAWLDRCRAGRAVQVKDTTEATAMVALQGPQALALAEGLFPRSPSELKYYFAMPTEFAGCPCVVSRTGYTGEDGLEVILDAGAALRLWEELVQRGALPCGLGARDTLRLEAAMPLYGHELDETIDPIQAGLGWAVKFDKAFMGREAILAADPNRPVRVGLSVEGKRAAREGTTILLGTEAIGRVTSGSFAPFLARSIAMGYVPPGHAQPGTVLTVDIRGTPASAQVVPLPFYKRSK